MSGDGGSVRLVQMLVAFVTAGFHLVRGPRRSIALKIIPKRARELGLDVTRPRSTGSAGTIYTYSGEGPHVGRVSWRATSGFDLEVLCDSHRAGELVVDGVGRGALDDTEQITDPIVREEVENALRTVSGEMALWADADHRSR